MRNTRYILLLTTMLSVQPVFAEEMTPSNTPSCDAIASACLNAGFTRGDTADKQFWLNCMKPVVLGKTVQGVEIDATTAKKCRADKITELKEQLKEFQSVSSR
jgi:hypothetical protein